MGVDPITSAQARAVQALLSARRIEAVPADSARAAAFLAAAADRVGQLPLLTSDIVKYDVAYDAMHDVGEAFLAAHGYRTTNGVGQHEALGRFLRAILDSPPGERAARKYDRFRRARNRSRYTTAPIGSAEVRSAEQAARELLSAARERGVGT